MHQTLHQGIKIQLNPIKYEHQQKKTKKHKLFRGPSNEHSYKVWF